MGDTGNESWLPKLPDEAKPMNDFLLSVSKHGQAEAAQTFVDALKDHDYSTALKARDEIMDFAQSTHTLDNLGKGLDLFDKAGKALEIAEAASRGDYEYAAAKTTAEVVDSFASGYLQSLGPGGVAIDFIAHQSGEVMSDALGEYAQVGPNSQNSEADFNIAAHAAYADLREYTDRTVREQLDAGQSPTDVQHWARDYMAAHGAIYKDLEHMDGMAGQSGRLNLDQANIVDTTYDLWEKLDPDTRGPLHSEKLDESGRLEHSGGDPVSIVAQAANGVDFSSYDVEVVSPDSDVIVDGSSDVYEGEAETDPIEFDQYDDDTSASEIA